MKRLFVLGEWVFGSEPCRFYSEWLSYRPMWLQWGSVCQRSGTQSRGFG